MTIARMGDERRFPSLDDDGTRLGEGLARARLMLPGRRLMVARINGNADEAAMMDVPVVPDAGLPRSVAEDAIAAIEHRDRLEAALARINCEIFTAKNALGSSVQRGDLRNAAADIPKFLRLFRKLRENPHKYFSDSKIPFIRNLRHIFIRKRRS